MAKASVTLSPEITNNPAIAAAAAEIHTLINSQPRSPTKDELVAVIAAHLGPTHTGTSPTDYLEAEWERYAFVSRVGAKIAPGDPQAEAVEAKCDALIHAVRAQARRILERPIKTPLDLTARAWLVLLASDFECDIDLPEAARRGNVAALPARLNVEDTHGDGAQAAVDIALYILHGSASETAKGGAA